MFHLCLTRGLSLILLFAAWSFAAEAGEYPIQVQTVSFGGTSYLQATETTLTPNASGRFTSLKGAQATVRAGACKDALSDFQKRPLQVMRDRGYITQTMFESLSRDLPKTLDPRQFLLVTLFSDIPHSEALALFGGSTPESRRLMEWQDKQGKRWVRIGRGAIFAVRGQILHVGAQGKEELRSAPVPWELGNQLPSGLTRKIDRAKVPALIEIGRAFSEQGVLPGDIRLAVRTLALTVEKEFNILGIPPSQVLMSGHFLDSQHTRLFSSKFPLRPLSPELERELEENLIPALARIEEIPLPSMDEWKNYNDAVVVGSLQALMSGFKVEDLSEVAYQVGRLSQGKVTGASALHMVIDFFSWTREDFDYQPPGYRRSPHPIMLRDRGTVMPSDYLIAVLRKYGLIFGTPICNAVRDYVQALAFNPEPDSFMESWSDPCHFIRGTNMQCLRNDSVLEVANLDTEAALAMPIRYLASVLLSITDLMRTRIEAISPEIRPLMVKWTNEKRATKGLPPIQRIDLTVYLESFGISLASVDPQVQTQLRNMGGKPIESTSIEIGLRNGNQGYFGIHPTYVFEFNLKQVREIERMFPDLTESARNRFSPGAHAKRLQLLQSSFE